MKTSAEQLRELDARNRAAQQLISKMIINTKVAACGKLTLYMSDGTVFYLEPGDNGTLERNPDPFIAISRM
jgi:hypothetical protein